MRNANMPMPHKCKFSRRRNLSRILQSEREEAWMVCFGDWCFRTSRDAAEPKLLINRCQRLLELLPYPYILDSWQTIPANMTTCPICPTCQRVLPVNKVGKPLPGPGLAENESLLVSKQSNRKEMEPTEEVNKDRYRELLEATPTMEGCANPKCKKSCHFLSNETQRCLREYYNPEMRTWGPLYSFPPMREIARDCITVEEPKDEVSYNLQRLSKMRKAEFGRTGRGTCVWCRSHRRLGKDKVHHRYGPSCPRYRESLDFLLQHPPKLTYQYSINEKLLSTKRDVWHDSGGLIICARKFRDLFGFSKKEMQLMQTEIRDRHWADWRGRWYDTCSRDVGY